MSDVAGTRRAIKRLLLHTGSYGLFWQLRALSRRFSPRTTYRNLTWRLARRDETPVPPASLRFAVSNHCDIAEFVASGDNQARIIESLLEKAGIRFADQRRVLDFGCGCGRVLRHFANVPGVELHGCDYNPRLIAWCTDHLALARFATNGLEPPLPYAAGSFDLIYALSVFTHLDEELCTRWLQELRRVLSPEGTLLATTHGESCFQPLDAGESGQWASGRMVVRSVGSVGANLCEAYHPPAAFRELASRDFPTVSHFPQGSSTFRNQDYWVLRVRAAVGALA